MIAEIETDKATMEVEAVDEGRIGKLLVAEGTEHVPVNQPNRYASHRRRQRRQRGDALRNHISPFSINPTGAGSRCLGRVRHAQDRRADQGERRQRSRQAHLRLAFGAAACRERSIELTALTGSGPHGRIVKSDVERAVSAAPRAAPVHPESIVREPTDAAPLEAEALEIGVAPRQRDIVEWREAPEAMSDAKVLALYEPGSYELVPHDTMRRFIAERLTLSKQTIPHFYLAIDCDIDALLAARARLNGTGAAGRPTRLQALGQRFHHQGARHGAANGARRQLHLDRKTAVFATAPPTSPWRSRSKAAACSPP